VITQRVTFSNQKSTASRSEIASARAPHARTDVQLENIKAPRPTHKTVVLCQGKTRRMKRDERLMLLQLLQLLLLLLSVSSSSSPPSLWSSSLHHLTSSSSSTDCDESYRALCSLVNLMQRTGKFSCQVEVFGRIACKALQMFRCLDFNSDGVIYRKFHCLELFSIRC